MFNTVLVGLSVFSYSEAVRRRPYGATSDIWALGCLMITILTGQPPFQASVIPPHWQICIQYVSQGNTVEDTFRRVRCADYSLPESLSYEAKDLIRGLLQIVRNYFGLRFLI
jgi:serine/threonine protein kinase